MNDLSDQQLLRDYAGRRSEAAFAELVRRHVDLVYSAAMRMVHDMHLAEDVTQSAFVALAQNARQLTDRPALSGWLHRTAQNLATKTVRGDVRRRAREQEAAAMNELLSAEPDALWEHIAPHLDDALGELTEPDRDALLLRYFERKSAREIAQTLGVSDEAAQKRVTRAVERLREFFAKRGVTVGASGLVVVISANAVQAAPVGLAVTILTAAALAETVTAATIATHATVNWINAKSIAAIVASVLVAGTSTYLVQQHNVNRLWRENESLAAQQETLMGERDAALSSATENNHEMEHLRKERTELLRLRGEIGMLRGQTSELANLKAENLRLRKGSTGSQNGQPAQASTAQGDFPKESWAFTGYATPEAALESHIWARSKGDRQTILASSSPNVRKQLESAFGDFSDSELVASEASNFRTILGYQIVDREVISDSEIIFTQSIATNDGQSHKIRVRMLRLGEEWRFDGPSKVQ